MKRVRRYLFGKDAPRWRRWISVAALLAMGGFLVAASGVVPITASSGHWLITEKVLRFSMQRSIGLHSLGTDVPELDDPALIRRGAGHFETGCRSCHGVPGRAQPRIALGMTPKPPELVPRIQASNPRKLFYVVKHGIKFTGMPAWPSQQRDDEVWAVVAFLMTLPALDSAEYARWVHEDSGASMEAMGRIDPTLKTALRSCVRCHGADGLGRGKGAFPRLAGQREVYLRNALNAYARSERHSGFMEPVAAGLTPEAIEKLSEYYSQLRVTEASREPGGNGNEGAVARGRQIAHEGIPARRVPSCVDCHTVGGKRTKPEYPLLAGQPAWYLRTQLGLFKKDHRGGSSHAHLMKKVVERLEPAQMDDVAAYFASLPHPTEEAVADDGREIDPGAE